MRTFVYVDGFNLYFGALRHTPYRWLDVQRLCELTLAKHNRIERIKYFTAHITQRPRDAMQPARQQAYLRALKTLPNLDIILGHFLTQIVKMPLAGIPLGQPLKYVSVLKTEEKGSDVNLATHLVHDAHLNRFEMAVVVSNDSDFLAMCDAIRRPYEKLRTSIPRLRVLASIAMMPVISTMPSCLSSIVISCCSMVSGRICTRA